MLESVIDENPTRETTAVVDQVDQGILVNWIYTEHLQEPLACDGDPWVACILRFGVWLQWSPDDGHPLGGEWVVIGVRNGYTDWLWQLVCESPLGTST